MRNLINYIGIIKSNLHEFNYVIVDVEDYKGKIIHIRFDRTQDIGSKCELIANNLGDGNEVLSIRCKY